MARRPFDLEREFARELRKLRKAFIKRFGREPGPGDPLFLDPDAPGDTPVAISEEKVRNDVLQTMEKGGIPPEIAYAYAKTGYLIVQGLQDRLSAEARAEWDAAIEEYHRLSNPSWNNEPN